MKTSHLAHASTKQHFSYAIKPLLFSMYLALSTGFTLSSSSSYAASEALIHYQVKAGSLAQALGQFALQSDIVFSFEASLAEGLNSHGLTGHYSIADGLEQLLASTNLSYRWEG